MSDGIMNKSLESPAAVGEIDRRNHIQFHKDVEQGSEEWHALRCGILTASEMKLIITPTLKIASNDKERGHLYELLAQRITGYVEPRYISDDMLRGKDEEIDARIAYDKHYARVDSVGFVTNSKWGFTIGYSPDGLVGDDGLIECKSRNQKYQVRTIIDNVPEETIDAEFVIQVQTGLLVTERKWCDLVSYCGGLPMATVRVYPIEAVQDAIVEAAIAFESRIAVARNEFNAVLSSKARLIPTERKIHEEMHDGISKADSAFFNDNELKGGIPL
jgi:YqaJ-like viral recombinase domain